MPRSTGSELSPASSSASSAHAVWEAVDSPEPRLALVGVGAQVLAPAAVVVLDAIQPAHGARHGRMLRRKPRLAQRRQHRAGAVQVVRAPATEPRALRLLLRAAATARRAGCADRSRALRRPASPPRGPSRRRSADRSPRRSRRRAARGRAGACCPRRRRRSRRPRTACPAPTRRRGAIAASEPSPIGGARAAQRHHHLGGVVDVGVVVVVELERPAAGREVRAPHRPVARHADLLGQHPVGALLHGGSCAGATPASRSASMASAVSHTGDWQASRRRWSPSSMVKPSSPARPSAITG